MESDKNMTGLRECYEVINRDRALYEIGITICYNRVKDAFSIKTKETIGHTDVNALDDFLSCYSTDVYDEKFNYSAFKEFVIEMYAPHYYLVIVDGLLNFITTQLKNAIGKAEAMIEYIGSDKRVRVIKKEAGGACQCIKIEHEK